MEIWVLWYMIVTLQTSGFAHASHEPRKEAMPNRDACVRAMGELLDMETDDRYFYPVMCLSARRAKKLGVEIPHADWLENR